MNRREAKAAAPPRRGWTSEALRKAIHLGFLVLPLGLVYEWLPWPRGKGQWVVFLAALTVVALTIDLFRIHHRRMRKWFLSIFRGLIRGHEHSGLLGSTYLLLASLLAVEIFPRPIAAAAIGFTVLGDGVAALVGRAWGKPRLFGKSIEGTAAGLGACLAWALFLTSAGIVDGTVALAGALVASLVELLPIPLDDNFAVTLSAGYMMKFLAIAS